MLKVENHEKVKKFSEKQNKTSNHIHAHTHSDSHNERDSKNFQS